jgi:hypothetical protein
MGLIQSLCPRWLTGETIGEEYITEYSTDKIEMHTGAIHPGQRVVLVGLWESNTRGSIGNIEMLIAKLCRG